MKRDYRILKNRIAQAIFVVGCIASVVVGMVGCYLVLFKSFNISGLRMLSDASEWVFLAAVGCAISWGVRWVIIGPED
jgi:hypothetical protein